MCFPGSGVICTKLSIIAEAGVYNITTIDSGYVQKKYKHLNWEIEYECYNYWHDYLKNSEWINKEIKTPVELKTVIQNIQINNHINRKINKNQLFLLTYLAILLIYLLNELLTYLLNYLLNYLLTYLINDLPTCLIIY